MAIVDTFLNAVGMILIGITNLKSHLVSGWRRYAPLFIGGYLFLYISSPGPHLTGQRPSPMVGLWFIPWLLLGVAIGQRSKTIHFESSHFRQS